MPRINVQQGELAHWLQQVSERESAGVSRDEIPAHISQALLLLLCVKEMENGQLVLTDKGRLALRMEGPGAIHVG